MPSARKLPSGNWFIRVQKTVNGVKHNEEFTAETKAEAEYLANKWKLDTKESAKPVNMTFDKAFEKFIEDRTNILSPSTIRSYSIMRRNCFDDIKDLRLCDLNSDIIQRLINNNAKRYSYKSLKNQLGAISVVCGNYDMKFKVKLPPKEKKELHIPTNDEIKKIIEIIKGSKIECQILFALMLGLRQSEIAALKWENLKGNKITIHGAIVPDENNQWTEKKTNKSYASARTLQIPDYLMNKLSEIKQDTGYMFDTKPTHVNRIWRRLTEKHNLPPFRVHDLRHCNASIMLLLGTPDKYAMERLGQSDPSMIKNVYQHTFDEEHQIINDKINTFFNEL